MKKLLKDWFTAPGNNNYEAGRALWFVSVVAAIGFTGAHLYQNGAFDILEFGGGMAALIAAGGWGVGAKDMAGAKALAS
ncbi:MAG: hypothetical protein RQ750_13890 [Roseovarius sp.]|nr:hypothetical protein [Roseovarius sp.]